MNDIVKAAVRRLEPKYKPRTDKEIITDIGLGKNTGDALFYLLFGRYAEMLEALFLRQAPGRIEFDDFMLELDMRLFNNWYATIISFDESKASFKTYLGKIAHNLLYDMRAREMPVLDVFETLRYAVSGIDDQELFILVDAINSHPDKNSRYVLLKTVEGYKSKEIAEMLTRRRQEEGTLEKDKTLTPAYIDTIRSRTLKSLRRTMSDERIGVSARPMSVGEVMASVCLEAAMPVPKSKAVSLTGITNPFMANILKLYNQMMEGRP